MGGKLWQKEGRDPRLDDQVEAFTVGDDHLIDAHILADDCWASIAHAAGLTRADILSSDELADLQKALLALIDRHEREGVPIERAQEDCHTAIEAALTAELGEVGRKIQAGRSRNDQVLTALRLFTRRRIVDVAAALLAAAARLQARAEAGVHVPMRGYSHTRPAMPTTLGVWLGGFVESLLDDSEMLRAAYALNDRSPLGTAAGFGSPIPLDREYTRELLGFTRLQVNALYCQAGRGKVEATVLHALECIQATLARLASDLILFSTDEFGFASLPEELTTGSSLMPQKRNPDVLESVRGRAAVLAGAAAQVRAVGAGLTSGYHRDYQLLKGPLISGLAVVEASVAIMERVVGEIRFDERALAASCTREIYAADLALERAKEGVPFRDAYRAALAELAGLKIDEEFVSRRVDAYRTVGSMGQPGLDRYRKPLVELARWVEEQRGKLAQTRERLRGCLAD